MKKISLFLLLTSILLLISCQSTKSAQSKSSNLYAYVMDNDEMSDFLKSRDWLLLWERGEIEVPADKFGILYENYIGQNTALSLLWENFFRYTDNKDVQKVITDYILENKLEKNPYEKALLKKYNSEKKIDVSNNHEVVTYSYKDKEYDENINYFDFYEIHPFNDEFGVMILDNDWQVMTINSTETGESTGEKKLFAICGGGTNSMTIHFEEIENVKTEDDLYKAIDVTNIASKFKDNWLFFEFNQTGILENCGADNYYVGFGTGPDMFIPAISDGEFVTFMYNKELEKVYKMDIFLNFSKININYETRNRLFNTMLFYTLFAYCD